MTIVTIKGDRAFANSRNVAEFFDKRHDNVLRDVYALFNDEGGSLNFEDAPYIHPTKA